MNNCTLIGRFVADPVIRDVGKTKLVTFSLAIEEYRKDKDGNKKKRVFVESQGKLVLEAKTQESVRVQKHQEAIRLSVAEFAGAPSLPSETSDQHAATLARYSFLTSPIVPLGLLTEELEMFREKEK